MKTITIYEEIDGYINEVPYRLLEFEKDYHGDYAADFRFNYLKKVKELNPLLRWVWWFFNEYTCDTYEDGFPMYLLHVTPKQIAEALCLDEESIDMAIKRLVGRGVIKKYILDGKDHIYAVTSNYKA